MQKFRWPTTLILLGIAVALISVVAFLGTVTVTAQWLLITAILVLVVVAIFGRQGV
jgi:hypothetical protein